MAGRTYDVVVFGATGFTGSLVVEYLARAYATKSLKWAIAGRNEAKLKDVRASVAKKLKDETVNKVDIIVADAKDAPALNKMAKATKVVLSTTGPFWKFGSDLVAACVTSGTSYCDITGESPWVKEMIEKHDATAKANKCRIVSFCGMDCIPSDVGCHVVAKHLREKHKCGVDHINSYILAMKGGVSGGTIASMFNFFEQPNFAELRKEMGSPYELIPRDGRPSIRQPDANAVSYEEEVQRYTTPFVMAGVNSKIVHRTNYLLNHIYGPEFRYREKNTVKGDGWGSWLSGWLTTLGLGAFSVGAYFSPTRNLLRRMLPKPGEGPDEHTRETGKLVMRFYGVGDSAAKPKAVATFVTHHDPGYAETATMLAESAICLAQDTAKLPERYGFLTPIAAMGDTLVARLQAAGIDITVEDDKNTSSTPPSSL